MTVAFIYHFITEDVVNLQEPQPEEPVTIPATAKTSLKVIANQLMDLTEELDFNGWTDEHQEQRDAGLCMAAARNKNNRLLPGQQDPMVAECALAHIMNLHGVKDLDGSPVHEEQGKLRAL